MFDTAGSLAAATPPRARGGERVVVFGGTGFVGSAIAAAFAAESHRVTTAQRHRPADEFCFAQPGDWRPGPWPDAEAAPPPAPPRSTKGAAAKASQDAGREDGMAEPPIGCIRCDATRLDQVRRAAAGATVLVNAVLGTGSAMLAATRAIAQVSRETGCRLLHVSSMSVYGGARGEVAEDAPLLGLSPYARAKIACEATLAGSAAIILRPGLIVGPGDEQWMGRFFRLLRARRLGDLGPYGDGRCNLVHADDVGAAAEIALRNPEAEGLAINLAAPNPLRWNSLLIAAACALGETPVQRRETWQLWMEARLFAPPLHAGRRVLRRAGLRRPAQILPDALTPALMRLFGQDIWLDQTRADRLLGLEHQPLADTLSYCARWFRHAYPKRHRFRLPLKDPIFG